MSAAPGLPEIQMLWVRGALSAMERLSIASYLRNGHPVRLFSYDPIPDLPEGTQYEDARAILPESAIFTNPATIGNGGLTVFANFFRYQLLLERGGVWSDCDMVCLKPLGFLTEMPHVFATERVPPGKSGVVEAQVASCLFMVPPNSPVVARTLEIARGTDLATAPWGSTGPRAVQQAVTELGLGNHLLAPEVACPIDWWQFHTLISGMAVLPQNTHAIHLWGELWRRNFFDRNASYDPLCLYERLKAHFLPANDERHG